MMGQRMCVFFSYLLLSYGAVMNKMALKEEQCGSGLLETFKVLGHRLKRV